MKTCTKCGIEKPLDEFSRDKSRKDGRKSQCKDCRAAHERNRYATDPVYAQRSSDLRNAHRRGEKLEPIGLARPTDERFDEQLMPIPNTGCLLWMGGVDNGYGKFRVGNRVMLAHRFAYWRHYGVIPKPEIHHKCFNRLCCEPSHLQAVTKAEHEAIHAATG